MDNVQTGVTVKVAASKLGLSEQAVRKRISRGSLESYKVDSRVYVVLPAGQDADSTTSSPTLDNVQNDVYFGLIGQLRQENTRLWAELEVRNQEIESFRQIHAEELQRRDVLALEQQRTISELAGQLRALQAIGAPESHQSTEFVEFAQSVIETETEEPEATTRPWWRFW